MMHLNLIKNLGLRVCEIGVKAQKIKSSKLDTYGILIAYFSVEDKQEKSYFFEEIFLLVDISIDIALKIPFLTLNNIKIDVISRYLY